LEDRLSPATLIFNTTADNTTQDNFLTLREAILLVNNSGNATAALGRSLTAAEANQVSGTFGTNDTVTFNIAPSGMQTIQVASALPTIMHPVVIDGNTGAGSGWQANSLPLTGATAGDNAVWTVTLDGSLIGSGGDGLAIAAGGSTVQGLVIQNFSSDIHLTTNGNDLIAGNYLSNAIQGVFVDNVPNNTVGGTTAGARNVCGVNWGVEILGPAATGNQVQGNYIGTDGRQLLTAGLSSNNPVFGVLIINSGSNIVGGTSPGAGNVISNNGRCIQIGGTNNSPASGNVVQGNYIGLNAAGTAFPIGGGPAIGIRLFGTTSHTTIGGTTPAARNVIAGSLGITLDPGAGLSLPTANVVQGNYIGTNAAGNAALLPSGFSIGGVQDSGSNNTIGGVDTNAPGAPLAGAGNLISGFPTAVALSNFSSGSQLQGNLIGTDATGTRPIPSGLGVHVGGSNNLIGGTTPGVGNTIAFNNGPAVSVFGTGVSIEENVIYGNNDINGSTGPAIDNLGQDGDSLTTLVDTNWPGGPFTGTDNSSISNVMLTQSGSTLTYSGTLTNGLPNMRYLVYLNVTSLDGNYWGSYYTFLTTDATGQVSFANLSYPAPSGFPNTQGSLPAFAQSSVAHSLGNHDQNFPVLTSASNSASGTTVSGTLNGQANTSFRIEFFSNTAPDPTGYGQGQTYLGFTNVTTDSTGNASFLVTLPGATPAGQVLSATATNLATRDTSEFSLDITVRAASGTGASIVLSGGTNPGSVQASLNGTALPTFIGSGPLYVQDSTTAPDTYTVSFGSTLTTPITVVGNGNDTLTANGSTDPNTSNYIIKTSGNPSTISWASASGPPAEIVTYSGTQAPTINGGAGPNFITDPGSGTIINGGPRQNTITITATSGSGVVINGGPSTSTNTYIINMGSLLGPVTINSTTGTCTVTVYAPGGSNTLTLSSTQLTGAGQTINLNLGSTATSLTVDGSAGNNQLIVQGTPPAPVTDGRGHVAPTVGAIVAPSAPVTIGTTISASAPFTEPDGSSVTAVWAWGDGSTTSVPLTGSTGTVNGTHAYAADGVYTVTLTVTNPNRQSGQSVFQYVVVYNPGAGFVTGGGWITSPAGAYPANPALTGPANFGFNARYQSGQTVPTGNTEFQFPAANLNFYATGYAWLVITTNQAQYQGSGTLNGAGNYGFLVTALDNGGSTPDKFRLKIWDKNNNNAVIYDTQPGAPTTAAPTMPLGGGRIQVHTNAQLAAGGARPAGDVAPLTPGVLQPVIQEAIVRWQAAGIDNQQLSTLRHVTVGIAAFPGPWLGMAFAGAVWIDQDAAGYGCYVDVSPASDAAFPAGPGSAAFGKMDLLTVVTHELGHELGLDDTDGPGLMAVTLPPGTRRLPGGEPEAGFAAGPVAAARPGLAQPARATVPEAPDRLGLLGGEVLPGRVAGEGWAAFGVFDLAWTTARRRMLAAESLRPAFAKDLNPARLARTVDPTAGAETLDRVFSGDGVPWLGDVLADQLAGAAVN
jgi:hypothetical protein